MTWLTLLSLRRRPSDRGQSAYGSCTRAVVTIGTIAPCAAYATAVAGSAARARGSAAELVSQGGLARHRWVPCCRGANAGP
jgi:hypothetical protein